MKKLSIEKTNRDEDSTCLILTLAFNSKSLIVKEGRHSRYFLQRAFFVMLNFIKCENHTNDTDYAKRFSFSLCPFFSLFISPHIDEHSSHNKSINATSCSKKVIRLFKNTQLRREVSHFFLCTYGSTMLVFIKNVGSIHHGHTP